MPGWQLVAGGSWCRQRWHAKGPSGAHKALASLAQQLTVNENLPSLGCGWASGAGPAGQGGGEGLKGAEKVALETLTGGAVEELKSVAADVAQEPCRSRGRGGLGRGKGGKSSSTSSGVP